MENLIIVLFFVSLISLIVGLINPNLFKKFFGGRKLNRKFILKIFGIATAVLFFIIPSVSVPVQKQKNDVKKVNVQTGVIATSTEQAVSSNNEIFADGPTVNNPVENKNKNSIVVSSETVAKTPDVKVESNQTKDSALTSVASSTILEPSSQYVYYSVTKIVDGDTIKISMDGKEETLRLIGMDTPETVDPRKLVQCFGVEASNEGKSLLSGKTVRIEADSSQDVRDKYGRLLVYVYRNDGLSYNKYMIEHGYAHEYTYEVPYKYQIEFKAAQKLAQDNQRGLWSPDTCNGDTTKAATSSTLSNNTNTSTETVPTGKFYTSSYSTSKYYYPENCSAWQSLGGTPFL